MTLYELTGEFLELFQLMEDPEMDEEALRDTLEGMEGEFDAKIDGWCRVVKSLEADAKALKDESKRLADRGRAIENRITNMKAFMMQSMQTVGKTEAGELLKAKIQKNGGVAPLVFDEGVTPEQVPPIFRKVMVDFDNAAIRAALDEDQVIGFAHYGERGESLRTK